MVGTTLDGTVSVIVHVRVPVSVPFTKLLQVIVHTPLVAFGIWLASDRGGVQETDAPTFVAIAPLVLPNQ
jgi:hypothetical protein